MAHFAQRLNFIVSNRRSEAKVRVDDMFCDFFSKSGKLNKTGRSRKQCKICSYPVERAVHVPSLDHPWSLAATNRKASAGLCIGAFGGARPLLTGWQGRSGWPLQGTGSNCGPGLQTLEAEDLVFQLLNAILLGADEIKQLPHQRCVLCFGNLRQRQ
jgi:hypothetical protein